MKARGDILHHVAEKWDTTRYAISADIALFCSVDSRVNVGTTVVIFVPVGGRSVSGGGGGGGRIGADGGGGRSGSGGGNGRRGGGGGRRGGGGGGGGWSGVGGSGSGAITLTRTNEIAAGDSGGSSCGSTAAAAAAVLSYSIIATGV